MDPNDPAQVELAWQEILQTDWEVNALLDSVYGDSRLIYDAAIVDAKGKAVLHTNALLLGKVLESRPDFDSFAHAGIRKQIQAIYGPAQIFDARIPLIRDNRPFGEVRIGVATTFLKDELRPLLKNALELSGGAILICLVIAAGLSNLALRPLAAISQRLDLISSGKAEMVGAPSKRSDEYGTVSTKIERLGRQMHDVKEVFSALKENLDQMMANLQDGVMLFTSDFNAVLVSASRGSISSERRRVATCWAAIHRKSFSKNSRLGRAIMDAFAAHEAISPQEIEDEQGRHIQVALDFIEERGERIGALLTLRDAESVHRIEDEIELSRRLSAIGRLTSGVAHEVKNPINAIVVHLEVLRQKMKEIDPDTRRHLDVIGSEIQRLDRVVQTLVDFTRPVELRLNDMDLRKVAEDVVMLASPAAEKHKVLIEREAGQETLPVRIDVDLVKQAILNIVLNGVQAMPQGGTLRMTLKREGENALIMVRDQGTGIPENIRDKVFNLYFTTKSGGSGIGLAMAYRVVQLHHGSLEFTSITDHGTTFYLRFPITEIAANGEAPAVAKEDSVSQA